MLGPRLQAYVILIYCAGPPPNPVRWISGSQRLSGRVAVQLAGGGAKTSALPSEGASTSVARLPDDLSSRAP